MALLAAAKAGTRLTRLLLVAKGQGVDTTRAQWVIEQKMNQIEAALVGKIAAAAA